MMRPMRTLAVVPILSISLWGAGCLPPQSVPPVPAPSVSEVASVSTGWVEIVPGMDRRQEPLLAASDSSSRIVLYRFDPAAYRLSFAAASSAQNVVDWSEAMPSAALVANGGYFHEDKTSSGWLSASGVRVGARSFDLDKSGLLVGGDRPRIVDTAMQAFPSDEGDALQSYPFLVKSGSAAVKEDSGKAARRTFAGFDAAGRFYVGAVDNGVVTLHGLAKRLAELDIAWTHVLNLDGGPSTGFRAKAGGWLEASPSWDVVPNVLVVTKRP